MPVRSVQRNTLIAAAPASSALRAALNTDEESPKGLGFGESADGNWYRWACYLLGASILSRDGDLNRVKELVRDGAIYQSTSDTEVLLRASQHWGDKVVDLMPGNGYFTRLFSTAVGKGGKVPFPDGTDLFGNPSYRAKSPRLVSHLARNAGERCT